MARPTFADPKTDFAFKRIVGSEERKDVLVAFLDDMLGLDEPHRIVTDSLDADGLTALFAHLQERKAWP